MRRALAAALFLTTVAGLAGCGNKGPLVLPTKPTTGAAPATSAAPVPAPATSIDLPTDEP